MILSLQTPQARRPGPVPPRGLPLRTLFAVTGLSLQAPASEKCGHVARAHGSYPRGGWSCSHWQGPDLGVGWNSLVALDLDDVTFLVFSSLEI